MHDTSRLGTQQISSISKYNYFGIKGRLSRNNVRTLCTCIMYGTDPVPVCTRTDSNGSKTKYRYCWCRYHFVNWYRYGTLDNNCCNFCTHILKKLYKIQLRKSYRYLFTSFEGFLNQYFELFRKQFTHTVPLASTGTTLGFKYCQDCLLVFSH